PDSFVVAVIVAKNWAASEANIVREKVDYAAIFNISPTQFQIFDNNQQTAFNSFIANVLTGKVQPKQ
ncbi:MAG: hypothetical protein ACRYFS_10110, partial [Janthinobacterium lividum]